MKNFFNRMCDIIKAEANSVADRMEDPEKMADQYVRNCETDVTRLKLETAGVTAQEMGIRRQLGKVNDRIAELNGFAREAVELGNDGDARAFLTEKNKLVAKREELSRDLEAACAGTIQMTDMYDEMTARTERVKARAAAISTTGALTRGQELINRNTDRVSCSGYYADGLDRFEQKADRALDTQMAVASLNSRRLGTQHLIESYRSLPGRAVEEELAALKGNYALAKTE